MTTMAPPPSAAPQETRQLGATGAPAAPLPPTGLQRQAASIRSQQPQQSMGASLGNGPVPAAPGSALSSTLRPPSPGFGATSLSDMANKLASSYGLQLRGGVVDEQGNFLQTPDQVAAASGGRETQGSVAAKFNLIADAIARQQQQRQAQKSEAALQAGIGLVNQRGRGSLAQLQQGAYQGLAQLYQSQQYQAADFSYFIQAEQIQRAQDLLNKQMKLQKKQGIGGAIGGILGGGASILTGVPGLGAVGSSAGSGVAGWF